jgi:hypothetical protein
MTRPVSERDPTKKKRVETEGAKRMRRLRAVALVIQRQNDIAAARIRKQWAAMKARGVPILCSASTLQSCKTFLLAAPRQSLWLPAEIWMMIAPQLAMTNEEIRLHRMRLREEERLTALQSSMNRTILLDAPTTGVRTGPNTQRMMEAILKNAHDRSNQQPPSG